MEVPEIKTKETTKRPIPKPRNIYLKKNNKDFIPYSYTLSKQNETINEGFQRDAEANPASHPANIS